MSPELTASHAPSANRVHISHHQLLTLEEPHLQRPKDSSAHSSPTLLASVMSLSPSQAGSSGSPPGWGEEEPARLHSPSSTTETDSAENGDHRRPKSCRVCGDHATGYNFNVITCESCKAFFRRNALRPKEFKCPYAEDCEVNAVSRRFCQKCRLRRCLAVGMKKEWILNEEQLRRRKNSRLNNVGNQPKSRPNPNAVTGMKRNVPLSIITPADSTTTSRNSFPESDSNNASRNNCTTLSPPTFLLASPSNSSASESSPGYQMKQLSSPERPYSTAKANSLLRPPPRVSVDHSNNHVVLSVDEYHSLIQMAQQNQSPRARNTGAAFTPQLLSSVLNTLSDCQQHSPPILPEVKSPVISMPFLGTRKEEVGEKFRHYVTSTVCDEMKQNEIRNASAETNLSQLSPAGNRRVVKNVKQLNAAVTQRFPVDDECTGAHVNRLNGNFTQKSSATNDRREVNDMSLSAVFGLHSPTNEQQSRPDLHELDYHLTDEEAKEIDEVRSAFVLMNEPLDRCRQRDSFMKTEKAPSDILNIMDVTMRRIVQMTKKLSSFNQLSHEAKFYLLKGGMIELITIRGVVRFDAVNKAWKSPVVPEQYQVPLNMFSQLNMDSCQHENRFLLLLESLPEQLRQDELAMDIFLLIALFTPRESIKSPSDLLLVEKSKMHYNHLFRRYLESVYGADAYKLTHGLPHSLKILNEIGNSSIELFMGTLKNSEEAEALPKEFFKVA